MAAKILNVDEVRSGLLALANAYPGLAELVVLPEKTHENQDSYALVIGKRPRCRLSGVMITSGMHGREWGGPDICVYLAADILEKYTAGTGLTYGNKSYSASVIRNMVERMTLVIFPCVNPDGVRWSHDNPGTSWRKNRNPLDYDGRNVGTVGVDNCRNFDFLWDYETSFDPAAWWDGMGSKNPGSHQYHGRNAFSEPETRNVRWLLDQFPHVKHYLDLHSFSGYVIHPWGDDENQVTNPWQNFRNGSWNGQRGTLGRPYGEYMCLFEKWRYSAMTGAISGAIAAVRNRVYGAYQLFLMPFNGPTYATSGVSFDWVYSRHLTDRSKRKVWGYGIEMNKDYPGFDITIDELNEIGPEVTAGLVRLCQSATPGFWAHLLWCRLLGNRG